MIIQTYGAYEYSTAHIVATHGFQVGRVNEVCWEKHGNCYRAYYTDGYKTQILGTYWTRLEAIAAAATAMERGAGGGFTSYFRPASEA